MSKGSSRRPPGERRAARKSLVELTELASRTIDDGQPLAPAGSIAAAAERTPPGAQSGELPASASSADLAVKIAKEFQARALEDFELTMSAALDHARDLVETRLPAAGTSKGDQAANPGDAVLTGLRTAAQCHAESLALVKANFEAALDYAQELMGARTPAEFVEVSSKLARKQCELAVKQASALKSLARGR